MTNPLKYILGPSYLLLASLWARLTQPKDMNRQGMFDPCPNDKAPCELARGGECMARTIAQHEACRFHKGKKLVMDHTGRRIVR